MAISESSVTKDISAPASSIVKGKMSKTTGCYSRDSGYDENEYRDLITKHRAFTANDFIRVGKWKDGVTSDNQWKPNVASVAYEIWEEAAKEIPTCPQESNVATFVENWSNKKYTDKFTNCSREKIFGPPRATTLLHFLSGGNYPIFDSRVERGNCTTAWSAKALKYS
jgi:hypothetical protein